MRLVRNGVVSPPIKGLPKIKTGGQGGLLDLAIDPDFHENSLIYFTFSEPVSSYKSRTSLAKARLSFKKIPFKKRVSNLSAIPPSIGYPFWLISISNNKKIFVTLGDRGEPGLVQNLSNHLGKIRVNRDGSSPDDNPFKDRSEPFLKYGHMVTETLKAWLKESWISKLIHGIAWRCRGRRINLSLPEKILMARGLLWHALLWSSFPRPPSARCHTTATFLGSFNRSFWGNHL